jgi:exosortase
LFLAAAAWLPAMLAASYVWRNGNFYDYGWFVPPAAGWLAIQRWRTSCAPVRELPGPKVAMVLILLLPWLLVLRVLGHADPSWRLPIGLLGLTAVAVSHAVIAAARGWRESLSFLWITMLCCAALPWPSVVEQHLVQSLTNQVVACVVEVFHLVGRPVEVTGQRLWLHGTSVDVTDGCSGVRSLQSFFMATWFFAELQRLRWDKALLLLAAACGAAFVVNSARSFTLAWIRFEHGQAAFDRAHDWLGLVAFLASALFFLGLSGKLSSEPRRRMLRHRATARHQPSPGAAVACPQSDDSSLK